MDLKKLVQVLEPIVQHQLGTYNHWRYRINRGKSGGPNGMKYEDAVRLLPQLYEELKAHVETPPVSTDVPLSQEVLEALFPPDSENEA